MKKLISRIKTKAIGMITMMVMVLTGAKLAFAGKRGEGFVDTAIIS